MKLCLVCNFQFEDEQELCPKDYSKLVPLGKDQLIGKLIQDRYRIDSMIAKGSMGVVYKATQELIGREVAVKVLHGYLVSDEESIKRFHKEAKAASRLNHPNITTLYDYGVLGSGQPYIVMDLLRGASLAEILKQRDYLPLDEAMTIFKQVCDALAEAHKRGVVHRDIKPENIMLEYTDKGVNVKVVDFGIATFLQEQDDTIGKITKTGTVCGSPTYMSPEQCDDNRVDHRSDIYSLGIVLYETITGKVPFSGQDIYGVMTSHVKDPVPSLRVIRPDLTFPNYLEGVIQKVLAKNPNDRYQSALDFFDALVGKTAASAPPNAVPAAAPVRQQAQEREWTTGSLSDTSGSITEAEVKNVVARALQKRLAQEGSGEFDPRLDEGGVPQVDPELVRKTVQNATSELNSRRSRSSHSAIPKRKMRRGVSFGMRAVGLLQQAFPLFLTIGLFASLFYLVKSPGLNATLQQNLHLSSGKPAPAASDQGDVDALIAANKLDQAKTVLEKRKKDGKMTDADMTNLNAVYLKLARKEAKAKHYKQAVALLEQISGDDKDDDEVRLNLRKWRHAAGTK
ncbi:MAG TPA: serine/threonine-protein kinase [Candidatus Obscuribacterales bacterium]